MELFDRAMNDPQNLEQVACPLCGGLQARPYLRRGPIRLVRCSSCDFVYLNPRLRPEILRQGYREAKADPEDPFIAYSFDALVRRARWFGAYLSGGRVLDIGIGTGQFLDTLTRHGFDAHGVELSVDYTDFVRRNYGIETVRVGTLEEADYPSGHFDAVALLHTLEHVTDPLGTVTEARRVLKPDGLLFVAVPAIDCRQAAIKKEHWIAICPDHLHYFTTETVARLLAEAGFQIVATGDHPVYQEALELPPDTSAGRPPPDVAEEARVVACNREPGQPETPAGEP